MAERMRLAIAEAPKGPSTSFSGAPWAAALYEKARPGGAVVERPAAFAWQWPQGRLGAPAQVSSRIGKTPRISRKGSGTLHPRLLLCRAAARRAFNEALGIATLAVTTWSLKESAECRRMLGGNSCRWGD